MQRCQIGSETFRMLKLGHPWIIADRYTKQWPAGKIGELISLVDEAQNHLATALYDPTDRIVARILDPGKIQLTKGWIEKKLTQAKQLRQHAQLDQTDVFRWLNGEGDGLPGVTVDCYADYLMLQLFTPAWDVYLAPLTAALQQIFQPQGIYRKLRPRETRTLEAKKRTKEYSRLIAGRPAPASLRVKENGLDYLVDLREGLNTGFFPDQRRNRQELMARSAGKRVLNLFAFTGAFSVAAAVAGAKEVSSIDVSAKYLDIARENFSINRLNPKRHEFIVGDVFSELSKLETQQRRFDIILFDPPSFSTTKKSRFSTHGGTSKLVAATLPLLESGGLLMSSSNHQKVSLDDYLKELRRGALQTGDILKTIFTSGQPEDFPCSVSFPEGRYLKFVISVKQ
ncbi:MAG: class I SAM-dependent rRNA methyltransferase [Desulfuromusa sp.]|nr:class I SAM-dependent rRNA methyltransferase [Desulfuromusa sp.]